MTVYQINGTSGVIRKTGGFDPGNAAVLNTGGPSNVFYIYADGDPWNPSGNDIPRRYVYVDGFVLPYGLLVKKDIGGFTGIVPNTFVVPRAGYYLIAGRYEMLLQGAGGLVDTLALGDVYGTTEARIWVDSGAVAGSTQPVDYWYDANLLPDTAYLRNSRAAASLTAFMFLAAGAQVSLRFAHRLLLTGTQHWMGTYLAIAVVFGIAEAAPALVWPPIP